MPDLPTPAVDLVLRAVREALADATARHGRVAPALHVAVALSGGRDSMVLLDALAQSVEPRGIRLSAAHVHHGLSPNADAWAKFCTVQCARRNVPIVVHHVNVKRVPGASLEATARAERYAALAKTDADILALAHHADDQAETLLLQLLRGAGPHGLAAMPCDQAQGDGRRLLRPLLALPRAVLDRYASARTLEWVDDESNANTGVKRNFIRHEITPRLVAAFPGYPSTLVRAAQVQAEAASLIDDLAELDAQGALSGELESGVTLDRAVLIALADRAPRRARNLLRWFLRQQGLRAPSAARLAAMLDQLAHAAADARVRIAHDGAELGFHRGQIALHAPPIPPFVIAWDGEGPPALPHGALELTPSVGAGVARRSLEEAPVTVRSRIGGERIQLAPDRPARALKRLLQEAGIPHWQRGSWPLIYCGSALAVVPGLGVDATFRAQPGIPGYVLTWTPRP